MSIKNIIALVFCILTVTITHPKPSKIFTIMLEPAGDAKHAGREIDDCFERGITLQFAEKLKKVLEEVYPGIRVILSRFPGESLEPLQNANFANRLNIDFYLSIHFFQETANKPKLYLYQFVYKDTDFWSRTPDQLCFTPYDLTHRHYASVSKNYANQMLKVLQQSTYKKYFECEGSHALPFALPFKPLIGIAAPALAIEASIRMKRDWTTMVEPLAQSLHPIIYQSYS